MSEGGGIFITLEGIDGAGKTSHLPFVADLCRARGYEVVVTREPGGTPVGEQLRQMVLQESMDPYTESLLVFAARREHFVQVIQPALVRGCCVISDRFVHASYAYQGGGQGVPYAFLSDLSYWTHARLMPDLTFFFDLPIDQQAERLSRLKDRFERSEAAFFGRVAQAYRRFAAEGSDAFCVLPADQARATVERVLGARLRDFFDQKR